MATPSILTEFGVFLRSNTRYWLVPAIVFLLLLTVAVVFFGGTESSPFQYAIF